MTNNLDLIGDEELLNILSELDVKTQHKYLKRVVSNAANIYTKAAERVIPKRTSKKKPSGKKWHPPGAGKKGIMKKMGKSRKTATVFVGPRTGTGNYETDTWYLKFWEFGTKNLAPSFRITSTYATNKERVEANMYRSIRTIFTRVMNKHKKL